MGAAAVVAGATLSVCEGWRELMCECLRGIQIIFVTNYFQHTNVTQILTEVTHLNVIVDICASYYRYPSTFNIFY